jgi:hypothetical protein
MDFQKQIEQRTKDLLTNKKLEFHILFVSDGNSRLSPLRGAAAMDYFKNVFRTLADVTVTLMTSSGFLREQPDLHKYNVLWIDNVTNPKFIHDLAPMLDAYENEICGGEMEVPTNSRVEDLEKEANQRRIMRNLSLRVIYALDEFVWDAPAGRQVNMFTARMVEDAMIIADEIVVPTADMMLILKKSNLIPEDKDVVVINTFVNDTIFPLHRINNRSSHYSTTIRRPKILIKGTQIPQNVQKFILMDDVTKDYKITISSVGSLSKDIYKKMQQTPDGSEPEITTIKHWAVPVETFNAFAGTLAIERDVGFDFVITCVPDDLEDNPYELCNADTDNIIAVAEGAVTIAGVKGSPFKAANHICVASNMQFSKTDTPQAIKSLIEKWKICVNWDEAYKKQRELLKQKTISSEQIMGGFFHAMLGRTLSDAYAEKVKAEVEAQKALEKEEKTKKEKKK